MKEMEKYEEILEKKVKYVIILEIKEG